MNDTESKPPLTRRQALTVAAGGVALAAVAGGGLGATSARAGVTARVEPEGPTRAAAEPRLPVIFLPHGGGPWPFVETRLGDPQEQAALADYLRGLSAAVVTPPRAVLVVSAHWEERVPTVMTGGRPPLLFDYYGFPPASYELTWPAPGDPALARRVRALLAAAGLDSAEDGERGFDHGAFVPLKLAFPGAEVPTVQLSLIAGLDPAAHLALGRALAPLRGEGVLVIGSGMSFHNLGGFGDARLRPAAAAFDDWLAEAVRRAPPERDARLAEWERAPAARLVHPREEHLLPLLVAAGAAGDDPATLPYRGSLLGMRISAVHFG